MWKLTFLLYAYVPTESKCECIQATQAIKNCINTYASHLIAKWFLELRSQCQAWVKLTPNSSMAVITLRDLGLFIINLNFLIVCLSCKY